LGGVNLSGRRKRKIPFKFSNLGAMRTKVIPQALTNESLKRIMRMKNRKVGIFNDEE